MDKMTIGWLITTTICGIIAVNILSWNIEDDVARGIFLVAGSLFTSGICGNLFLNARIAVLELRVDHLNHTRKWDESYNDCRLNRVEDTIRSLEELCKAGSEGNRKE